MAKHIDEVFEYLISETAFTIEERAEAILNFAKKMEAEKKITLKPKYNVIQRKNKYRGTKTGNAE